jgi:hypothetical protein
MAAKVMLLMETEKPPASVYFTLDGSYIDGNVSETVLRKSAGTFTYFRYTRSLTHLKTIEKVVVVMLTVDGSLLLSI